MTQDAAFVFTLIGIAGAMMASNRVRYDLVAIIVVLALIVSGILTTDQALAGFGSPVVIMVAALLVVGEMLDRTGIAHSIGNQILRYGGASETRLIVYLMLGAALLGCVMSSTAIVAIFIPIILRVSANTGLAQSRLLLPMSYAALISGMLTLIATPPNLVVSDTLDESGYEPLGFFSFFPIGLVVLIVAVFYMLAFGRKMLNQDDDSASEGDQKTQALLQKSTALQMLEPFALMDKFHLVEVTQRTQASLETIFTDINARILARRRPSRRNATADAFVPEMQLLPGDRLLVVGDQIELAKVADHPAFNVVGQVLERTTEWEGAIGLADILVHPEARVVGETIRDFGFRNHYGVDVLGVLRGESPLEEPYDTKLRPGDRLMIVGPLKKIDAFASQHHDFVLLSVPKERAEMPLVPGKYLTSLAILAGMVLLSISGLVPVVVAVLLAATAAVLFGTLSPERAYGAIHWSSIVLVAGMLPLADALQSTGGADVVVDAMLAIVGESGASVMMAMLFLVTAGLGLVLSNTASAVLVAPIAITAAESLGFSPYPFAICVLIAASAAFSTPVSTPVVTLVVAPGGYKFADFLKIGLPLTFLVGVVTVLITPFVFPL
ncbi:MAG: SLC13 family permease [Dinoroseobacter sp.]|nr:SLC13 family permease [Dinoroseobacter sp.]